jgi:hypothetical protein
MERDTYPDGPVRADLPSRSHTLARRQSLARMTALGAGVAAGADLATPGPAFAQATQKRELVMAQGGDVATFDPHMRTAANDIRVSFNIFDNLVARRADGKLHPGLATEWKVTGPQTYQFLEHNPWIVVLQPQEDYGLAQYVEFTPNSNQQLELRRFNFRLKRG